MCWCNPSLRTPCCGKVGCVPKPKVDDKRQVIQNFLNMVNMETQGKGGDLTKLEQLLDEYFDEH